MVAGSISMGPGFVVSQAGDDLNLLLERLQRLKDVRQLKISAQFLWRPVRHVCPVGNVDESHALWRTARTNRSKDLQRWSHRLEHGQRDGCAHSLQKCSPRNLPGFLHTRALIDCRLRFAASCPGADPHRVSFETERSWSAPKSRSKIYNYP